MKYVIGSYEFGSLDEYNAAKRDIEKIKALKKKGRDSSEIAAGYLYQIHEKHIKFETKLGNDYVRKFYDEAALPKKRVKIVERYVESKPRKYIKKLLLIPLYIVLLIAVGSFALWMHRDRVSRERLASIQEIVMQESISDIQAEEHVETDEYGEELVVETEPSILPQFVTLAERNSDFVGWLTIPDTKINYPIMYRPDDNDYYLHHDFDGNDDVNGLLVLDKRCSGDGEGINNLIHGHNMKSGAIFGSLKYYEKKDYYDKHPVIRFSTLYKEHTYEIFAVFKSTVYDKNTTDFKYFNYIQIDNEEQFNAYIDGVRSQALYETGIDVSWGDKLIALSTCEYSRLNGRLVVVGREKNVE